MKRIGLALLWLTLAIVLICKSNAQTPTNLPPPPPGFASRSDYLKSLTSEKKILDAYHAGLIDKDEAAQAVGALGNKASMDTYGKLVDQDGQPVVGATVQGALESTFADDKEYDTKTDNQGRFQFVGLHGTGLDLIPEKEGYDFDPKLPCSVRPELYMPSPSNLLVITMYKRHGGEPMKHIQIFSSVSRDGSVKRFDLLTNIQNNTGDLLVALTRNPLNIDPKDLDKPFDWSVKLELTNGGFQEITNIYPNEAPTEGYQKTVILNFQTNMVGWQSRFEHNYYFKSQGGQIYGRMKIEIHAGAQTPTAYFRAEIYANPAGSRNLEFDGNKQINR